MTQDEYDGEPGKLWSEGQTASTWKSSLATPLDWQTELAH